jgi:hypothetical protein
MHSQKAEEVAPGKRDSVRNRLFSLLGAASLVRASLRRSNKDIWPAVS